MTDKQQPEALRLAEMLTADVWPGSVTLVSYARECVAELRRLHAENTTLQQGYAAARLEIESLRARGVGPDVSGYVSEWSGGLCTSDEAMDGIAKLYAAQPAGAQQSGVAYAALPDADRDYMRKVVAMAVTMLFDGYKEDVTRVFSTGELSEFVTITAAMGGERVEDIYRRAWDLLSLPVRASHGQAPAQAAHQQEAQEPVAWYVTGCGRLLDEDEAKAEARHIGGTARAMPLYTAPQADSQPAKEAPCRIFLVTQHHSKDGKLQPRYGSSLFKVLSAHGAFDTAERAREDAENAYHALYPGYKQDGVQPFYSWVVQEMEVAPTSAARAPADSVTAPAGGETYHLGACIVEDMLHATVMRKEPGRAGAVTVLLSEQIPVEHLQDRDVIVNATPPAQAADSVLEDAARLDWLLLHISGAEFRRIGVHYSGNARRADVDTARKQGANHD